MEENNELQESAARSGGILFRYAVVVFILFLVVAGIVVCIIDTAFVEGKEWVEIGKRDEERIPDRILYPNRGNIYSSDGRLMATSFPRYALYMDFRSSDIDAKAFHQTPNGVDSLAYYLAKKFGGNENDIKNGLKSALNRKAGRYPLLNRRVSYADLLEIRKFPFIRLGKYKSGFIEEPFIERCQPFYSLASRTIGRIYGVTDSLGYTRGRAGLELQYDTLLRGEPGVKAIRRMAGGWMDVPVKPATDGLDIRTTIDIDIQDIAEEALLEELKRTGAESGAIVVMEVKTGEIKAITNMGRMGEGQYGETLNHAVADLLEPGSTFKVASIMVALEDGVCEPGDTVNTGNGEYHYIKGGRTITDHNANKGGFRRISVEEAIWQSSNIGVAKTILKGYERQPGKFIEGLARLGLMEDLRIDIPGSARSIIRKPGDKFWSKTSLPWMSFGYENQIPPVYMLAFYNAIANDGDMMRPLLVKEIMRDGQTIETFAPETVKKSICSNRTLRIVQDMLAKVVEKGTGKPARSNVIRIAGKTGTAQITAGGTYRGRGHRVSFVGYFPADKPEYSCIAVIAKPSPAFYPSGGAMSGSVVKQVAERIYAGRTRLEIRNLDAEASAVAVPASKPGDAKALYNVLDKLDIKANRKGVQSSWARASADGNGVKLTGINIKKGIVPQVLGMGAKDAVYLLENAGLQVNLSGAGRVVSQSLPSGQPIQKGKTIAITLK